MVGTATLGLADIMTCALTAAFLMIITGCLQMRDAYRALQGDVLILIAGTIALGAAMEKTGTSQLYAEAFLEPLCRCSPVIVLGGMILLTSISTQMLSNNATAVLLLPIAISTALGLGVDPKPFIIGVCIGASACFATPVGYQTNLMVYGPGGYRFKDYLKLGIPLNISWWWQECSSFLWPGPSKARTARFLPLIPFLNQDGNEKASEQRRDSTKKYGEESHSAADEVNA